MERRKFVKKEEKHKINNNITSKEVRLIGDNISKSGEIVPTYKALELADTLNLDLVLISPDLDPPIAKIVDYKKYLYLEEKKLKEIQKKQKEKNKAPKEIQFSPNIGISDIETKKKHIREFLTDNYKVNLIMKFKQGREFSNFLHKGELILLEIANSLQDICKVEALPKLNGKNMLMTLTPKK